MSSWLTKVALAFALTACTSPGENVDTDGESMLPRLEPGLYTPTSWSVSDSTCGSLENGFRAPTVELTWTGDDQIQWDEASTVICDLDAWNAATCNWYEFSMEYLRAADLSYYVETQIEATSTTSFEQTQPCTVNECSGFNCDVAAHYLGIDGFPCSFVFHASYALGTPDDGPAQFTLMQVDNADVGLAGREVTMNGAKQTAGDAGAVTFTAPPNSAMHFTSAPDEHLGLNAYFYAGAGAHTVTRWLWTDDELVALLATLGKTYDPAKGMVLVRAVDLEPNGSSYGMDGVTFDIDLEYGAVFVPDATQPSFYKLGNTSIGTNPSVIFANVTPGTTRLTYPPPPGFVCAAAYGGPPLYSIDIEVLPGTLTTTSLLCTPE